MYLGKGKASGAIRHALNAVCIHDRAFSKHAVKPTCVWKCTTLIWSLGQCSRIIDRRLGGCMTCGSPRVGYTTVTDLTVDGTVTEGQH